MFFRNGHRVNRMENEYKTILHRWFDEVWNQKRTDTIIEMMSEDTQHYGLTGPGGPPVSGVGNFREFHAAFLAAFPDLQVTVHDVVGEGDKMACRYSITGTHRGLLGDLEPSRVKVEFTGGGMCRLEGGKFAEVWNEIDFAKMRHDIETREPEAL